jgi:hypothetical protein
MGARIMTSQQLGDLALSIYQTNRKSPEIEALLDQFFSFPTSNEFERRQSCVTEIFTAPQPTFTSDLPLHLSARL